MQNRVASPLQIRIAASIESAGDSIVMVDVRCPAQTQLSYFSPDLPHVVRAGSPQERLISSLTDDDNDSGQLE